MARKSRKSTPEGPTMFEFEDDTLPTTERQGVSRPSKYTDEILAPYVDRLNREVATGVNVPDSAAAREVTSVLRYAAKTLGKGVKVRYTYFNADAEKDVTTGDVKALPENTPIRVRFAGSTPKRSGDRVDCPECGSDVAVTADNRVRTHGPRDNRCAGSGLAVEDATA